MWTALEPCRAANGAVKWGRPMVFAPAFAALLVLSACTNFGPPTDGQITQDIQAGQWMNNDLPEVVPGTPTPIMTGGHSQHVIP
jgi:hypothetical protein